MLWITLMIIYVLLFFNFSIFLATVFVKIKQIKREKELEETLQELEKDVKNFLAGEGVLTRKLRYDGNEIKTKAMLQLLAREGFDKGEENPFEKLGYVDGLIKKGERKLTFELIKQLGAMGSPKAFPLLLEGAKKENFEMSYQACYAISLLKIGEEEVKEYIKILIEKDFLRDRKIEMVRNLNINIDLLFSLIQSQGTEKGKVILIRALEGRGGELTPKFKEYLLKLLEREDMTKEIKISIIIVLADPQNKDFLDRIFELYRKEKEWEVRTVIAKALNNYSEEELADKIEEIKVMTYDENWWVRFNAAKVLARKGKAGINALVDLSLEPNKETADLAFYILDSDSNINRAIEKEKGENNG